MEACDASLLFSASSFLVRHGSPSEPQWLTLPPTPSLPTPVESGYAPVNGIRICYATFGRGTPVILLHGGLANANYWGELVPALAPHYRVIVMDSRGHGRSSRDAQPYGYDLMASDVVALMDFLKIEKDGVSLERRRDVNGSFFVPHDLPAPLCGAATGPLAGLTVVIKDMYDIAGSRTGGGNPEWLEEQKAATRNAGVVEQLLAGGR